MENLNWIVTLIKAKNFIDNILYLKPILYHTSITVEILKRKK